jgi:hypothetical protein
MATTAVFFLLQVRLLALLPPQLFGQFLELLAQGDKTFVFLYVFARLLQLRSSQALADGLVALAT